jgi:RNA polymerase sigma-70 factor (ECF subfamily)
MDTPPSLLERLRHPDDPEAWARFVRLCTPVLARWAQRAGLNEHDAADIIQDVFALLLREMPQFAYDPSRSFRAWLCTVATNKLRERRRRASLPMLPGEEALASVVSPDGVEAFWEAEYRQHLVGQALRLMQGQFAEATWRACWENVVNGKPAAVVAAELDMTPGAVRVARFRVLAQLRKELAGLLD